MRETADGFTKHALEAYPGLPPDGESGQFFGFDENGAAYVMRWRPSPGGIDCWAAVGFDQSPHLKHITPIVFLCIEENASRIKRWSHGPVASSIRSPDTTAEDRT